uniref:hypothetical protein n=1 Tax=Bartonella sp. CL29QHWL TaxID=3243522 RepID=UPI0035D00D28
CNLQTAFHEKKQVFMICFVRPWLIVYKIELYGPVVLQVNGRMALVPSTHFIQQYTGWPK